MAAQLCRHPLPRAPAAAAQHHASPEGCGMSVFEVRGGNDRRSMIKRYERKSKQEAIRELVDLIHCNWNQIEQLEARPAVAVPDGYALVPILPTPEMVSAAEEAYLPFGDMELAVR